MQIEIKHNNIAKALLFINRNFAKQITLDEIASECAMSKYHFVRTFKSVTGTTFRKYHNKTKIEASKFLLEKHDLNITEICYAVGFNDSTYFSRVFRDIEGISPSIYKKRYPIHQANKVIQKRIKQFCPFFEQNSASK